MAKLGALEQAFLGLMLAAGLGTAWLTSGNPSLQDSALPPIIWPIGVALLFDIVTAAMRGGFPPLSMPVRAAGVIAAMALYTVLAGRF